MYDFRSDPEPLIASQPDAVIIRPYINRNYGDFVRAIEKAGIIEQEADRDYFEITEKIQIIDEKSGAEIIALPDDDYRLNVMISFQSSVLNSSHYNLSSINSHNYLGTHQANYHFFCYVETW